MKLFSIVLLPFLLVACAAGGSSAVTWEKLASGRFILTSVNNQPFPDKGRRPEITFLDTMRVAGSMCNRFTGQGRLEKGILTVPVMVSTKMLCLDQRLNSMEQDLAAMLHAGATVSLDGGTLTLSRYGRSYIYTRP